MDAHLFLSCSTTQVLHLPTAVADPHLPKSAAAGFRIAWLISGIRGLSWPKSIKKKEKIEISVQTHDAMQF